MNQYNMKINYEIVEKLYYCRESLKSIGVKKPMTVLVEDAVNSYLPKVAKTILQENGALLSPEKWCKQETERN
ncbi:MAG: hypothetical protein AB1393_14355 [Candidatus Edwardsbacteria bacterium]